ncbi:hypothetical protein SAMN05421812_108256 [Asanoa hainanensis]|uniref:Uncharacterized protein n=1 Tax=Asanoa hainanensis TaxID=560556 RepID=A0A239NEN7_9ACTN|nr:hypothetical protein [Asanoa hainanensis]SNT53427.1 hypothetical protein SAMN05421812_108256 [Asanoa hainanensis]
MNTIEDLRAALDYPDPPAKPDTRAIIARGRRRRVVRRAAVGGGLAVVVAGVVAVNALGGTPAPPPVLVGSAPDPALVTASTTAVAEAPERFDPLTRTLHVGWIPAGLTGQGAEISVTQQSFGGRDKEFADGGRDYGLSVMLLAKGRPPTDFMGGLGMPRESVESETDDVNGKPAVCLSDPEVRGSCAALQWEYAPGAWARVGYSGSAGPTPEAAAAVARRVAESVRFTAGEPVRLPFTIGGSTAELPAARTQVSIFAPAYQQEGGEVWNADLCLAPSPRDVERSVGDTRQLCLGASKAVGTGARLPDDPEPNATVDGHDARIVDMQLIVWNVSGIRVDTTYSDWDVNPRYAYEDLRVAEDPADPADWPVSR